MLAAQNLSEAAQASDRDALTDQPTIGSFLRRDSMKSDQLKIGVDGGSSRPEVTANDRTETAATERLAQEGIIDPGVLHELRGRSLEDVEAAVHHAARCRSMGDPRRPGLIVYLLRHTTLQRRPSSPGCGTATVLHRRPEPCQVANGRGDIVRTCMPIGSATGHGRVNPVAPPSGTRHAHSWRHTSLGRTTRRGSPPVSCSGMSREGPWWARPTCLCATCSRGAISRISRRH